MHQKSSWLLQRADRPEKLDDQRKQMDVFKIKSFDICKVDNLYTQPFAFVEAGHEIDCG